MTLNNSDIIEKRWMFGHSKDKYITDTFKFEPNGSINGHDVEFAKFWSFNDDGNLLLLDENGNTTIILSVDMRVNSKIYLSGKHISNNAPVVVFMENVIDGMSLYYPWTYLRFAHQINHDGWEIGDYTYGIPRIFEPQMAKLKIGRFCSIAENVAIALGNHRTDTRTSYPFPSLGSMWPASTGLQDHTTKGNVEIGSDVWLAADAFISSGVKIGDGAVVAAYSVVTKDIPPYAVVAGNPAKIIKYRFDEQTIEELLELQWWNWSFEKISENMNWIMSCPERTTDAENRAPPKWRHKPAFLNIDWQKVSNWWPHKQSRR